MADPWRQKVGEQLLRPQGELGGDRELLGVQTGVLAQVKVF